MAAFTSKANGNWSASGQTTWNEVGVPGNGDTVTISHNVTVDTNTTVGTSPADATTAVITTSGATGAVIIAAGVTLTVRGNIYNNAGTSGAQKYKGIQLGAGSSLVFDSSATTPDTQRYNIATGAYADVYIAGSSGSHASITQTTGTWTINSAQGSHGPITATYCDFSKAGGASQYAAYLNAQTSSGDVSFSNCTFDNCGTWTATQKVDGGSISISDCTFTNSLGTLSWNPVGRATSTGTLSCLRNIFDKSVTFGPGCQFTIQDNYFGGGYVYSGVTATSQDLVDFSDNFVRTTVNTLAEMQGSIGTSYWYKNTSAANCGVLLSRANQDARTIDGVIIDYDGAQNGGDWIMPMTDASDALVTVQNCILLPNAGGNAGGKIVSVMYGGTSDRCKVAILHNTYVTTDYAEGQSETGVGVGESDQGGTDWITLFKSNLAWTPAGKFAGWFVTRQQSAKQDILSSGNADYNWGWNLDAGSEGGGYNCWTGYQATSLFSSGTPDANGGNGDPLFVDSSRNLATYDTAATGLNNAAGTAWAATTEYAVGDVRSNSDAGFYGNATINFRCISAHTSAAADEPGVGANWRTYWEFQSCYRLREDLTRIAALITWVKGGFAVQNADLKDAGHDSVTIGACEWLANPVSVTPPKGTLSLTGKVPAISVTTATEVTVPVAALSLTGYAPTVSVSNHQNVTVPTGALSVTGAAPTIQATGHVGVTVPAGALSVTGLAPNITLTDNKEISVAAGQLSLTGKAPIVTTTGLQNVTVPAGVLTLTGKTPTATATASADITVPAGALSLTGKVPIAFAGDAKDVTVPAGALTLTGKVPTAAVTDNKSATVPTGALAFTGKVPTAATTADVYITVPSGSLVFTGKVPQAVSTSAVDITIPRGSLTLTGKIPDLKGFGISWTSTCIPVRLYGADDTPVRLRGADSRPVKLRGE